MNMTISQEQLYTRLKSNGRRWILLILSTLIALAITACGAGNSTESNGKINVVATTGHIADALANIGGDAINLTGLLGPGVDPHLYKPTEGNVATFSSADLIVYNGLDLEAQMQRILEQMETRGVSVLPIGDNVPGDQLLNWDEQFPFDPHIWNDPLLWSQGIELMRDRLIELDSANAETYTMNTKRYLDEISAVHNEVMTILEIIPAERRVLITAHDAFSYFGRSYDLEVLGLQGISTESEASAAEVKDLATLIVARQIPAIFIETSVSPKTIEAVQAAVQAQDFNVQIGGSLYSDALGEEGSGAETYIGMIRSNAETLATALGE